MKMRDKSTRKTTSRILDALDDSYTASSSSSSPTIMQAYQTLGKRKLGNLPVAPESRAQTIPDMSYTVNGLNSPFNKFSHPCKRAADIRQFPLT